MDANTSSQDTSVIPRGHFSMTAIGSQIYKDPRLCGIFIPSGIQIGDILIIPMIKMIVICQVHVNCGLNMKINPCESCMVREDRGCILLECVSKYVVSKNLNTPI